ncbi:MAG: UDP-2,3-diacylglucosamine diphosphatase [Planctomycetota bacterium]
MTRPKPTNDPQESRLPAGGVPTRRLGPLEPGTLVITDLHLAPLGDRRTDLFEEECAGLVAIPRLIVLGDLFDVWVGRKQAALDGSRRVLAALRGLTDRGVAVEVVPGNRDSLLGVDFERLTGATLHREGFLASGRFDGFDGEVAFVHGDALCTLDRGYLRLRTLLRARAVRALSRRAPLFVARRIGRRLRAESENRKPFKLAADRSIRPAAVEELLRRSAAELVVCGHAHVARDERVGGGRWIVVAAWRESPDDRLRFD